jgi:hypothetical protein
MAAPEKLSRKEKLQTEKSKPELCQTYFFSLRI